eukprot:sb/3471623/
MDLLKVAGMFAAPDVVHVGDNSGDDNIDEELFKSSTSKTHQSPLRSPSPPPQKLPSPSDYLPRLASLTEINHIRIPDHTAIERQRWCKYCALSLPTVDDVSRHLLSQRHLIITGEYFLKRPNLVGKPKEGDRIRCVVCSVRIQMFEKPSQHCASRGHYDQLNRWRSLNKPLPPIKFYIDS